jgi:calcium-dependent protein kinase
MVEPAKVIIKKQSFISKSERLRDQYRIGASELGRGAYGVVKKGIHRETKEAKAIKFISKSGLDMDLFKKEFEIMRELDHPTIIKVYEWFEDRSYVYLVTEICEGGELLQRIQDEKRINEKIAANYFKEILYGIAHCHAKGICHR